MDLYAIRALKNDSTIVHVRIISLLWDTMTLKRTRSYEETTSNKKITTHPQQCLLDENASLRSRIKELETEVRLVREMAFQALHNQEQAFSEWQRSIEKTYTSYDERMHRI